MPLPGRAATRLKDFSLLHESLHMKNKLFHLSFLSLVLLLITGWLACSKNNSGNSQPLTTAILDTTITDTSIYIDITLDGKRTLGIQNYHNSQFS
jgi:hypothetical protein